MPENILALDTTLPHISLWLRYEHQEIVFDAMTSGGGSETIFQWLAQLSQDFPSLWDNLDAYALNIGPGRFNGVRCGLSIIGALHVLHPRKIYTCTTFDLMRCAAPEKTFSQYAIYAKKGHAYTQQGSSTPILKPFAALEPEGLSCLQCPEVNSEHSLDFVPVSLMATLINNETAHCHHSFETIVPVYTALI